MKGGVRIVFSPISYPFDDSLNKFVPDCRWCKKKVSLVSSLGHFSRRNETAIEWKANWDDFMTHITILELA